MSLAILHEDAHCLVVDKPCGLPTQAVGDAPSLEDEVRRHLAPEAPTGVYLGTVHRLDRPVSGVVLWAKNPRAARRLAEQFAGRSVGKVYWALVSGPVEPDQGAWDDWIGPVGPDGRARLVAADEPGARRAVSRYRRVEDAGVRLPEGVAWLELRPETGRTHQLRVQAAGRGWPIVGDSVYGSTLAWPEGIALHARELAVVHPITRQALSFRARPPAAWLALGPGFDRPA